MMMPNSNSISVTHVLVENLDLAFDKLAWHGPNLASSLRGVNFKMAQTRVLSRRSIWEQTLHAAYWKQRVVNKLVGTQKFPRSGSNWPSLPKFPNETFWGNDVQLLRDIHVALRSAVENIDPAKLDAQTRKLILGAAAHDTYHAGQIRLIRRMLGLSRKGNR